MVFIINQLELYLKFSDHKMLDLLVPKKYCILLGNFLLTIIYLEIFRNHYILNNNCLNLN